MRTATLVNQPEAYSARVVVPGLGEQVCPPPQGLPAGFTAEFAQTLGTLPITPEGIDAGVEGSTDGQVGDSVLDAVVIDRGIVGPHAPFGPQAGLVTEPVEPVPCFVEPSGPPFRPRVESTEPAPGFVQFDVTGDGLRFVALGLSSIADGRAFEIAGARR